MSATRVPTKQTIGNGMIIGWSGWPPIDAVLRGFLPSMVSLLRGVLRPGVSAVPSGVSDPPNGVADIIGEDQCARAVDGDADRAAASLAVGPDEAGDEIVRQSDRPAAGEPNEHYAVAIV